MYYLLEYQVTDDISRVINGVVIALRLHLLPFVTKNVSEGFLLREIT